MARRSKKKAVMEKPVAITVLTGEMAFIERGIDRLAVCGPERDAEHLRHAGIGEGEGGLGGPEFDLVHQSHIQPICMTRNSCVSGKTREKPWA